MRFEIEREGRGFALWLAECFVAEGTLAVCRLAAEACRVLLDERPPKIEDERDDRIVKVESGLVEGRDHAQRAVGDEVLAEFERRRRKKEKARLPGRKAKAS